MKKYINYLKYNIMYLLFIACSIESIAQNYLKIDHPLVGDFTSYNIFIKSITITSYETKVDFIACFTGHYIYLSPPRHSNSMYIRCGTMTYSLIRTVGIAQYDNVTVCEPNKVIEFSAIFYPFLNYEDVDRFDIIEGENGKWNFYDISTDKNLASNLSLVYERAYWRGRCNWESYPYKSEWHGVPKTSSTKKETRKKLKKDPNFKLE